MYFKIKEIMLKVVYFCVAYNPQKINYLYAVAPLRAHIQAENAPH